ncbi:MAG TPA: PQQ-binding-like beta-propeller repeat protein [Kofleriaceae bacterium]|nr:PQQ-binding-like beta-propeller repeat protein [Kofleriaceae bacterium]
MSRSALILSVAVLGAAAPAWAIPVHGQVYIDRNRDHQPSHGEPGVANAVVAFGTHQFVVTDGNGQFDLDLAPGAKGIVWVRVPDGFVPGPVWAKVDASKPDAPLDLGLRELDKPNRGPLTFVVTTDAHISADQPFGNDLQQAMADATALDPAPAFYTILGDVSQGATKANYDLVNGQLKDIAVPYIPVPGNHDWYDGGAAWFATYGPDNYSFDIASTHFVVWNLALSQTEIRDYLGAELSHVAAGTTIVALTHTPPSEAILDVLRSLGVSYVLTGHAHTNRVYDHDGILELNTEPFLMGGLDFTPAGYRVLTLDQGALSSYHRTTVDQPLLQIVAPGHGQCVPAAGGPMLAAVEFDGGDPAVTARIDCATPVALRAAGGWSWQGDLPTLAPGPHTLTLEARAGHASSAIGFTVCEPDPPPAAGPDWPQVGGAPGHAGALDRELAPPVIARWATPVGGHVLQAAPVIANGTVYVPATDLAQGTTGGVVALDLATGAIKWRTATANQVRGGVAIAGTTVTAAQVDGTVLGLDAASGAMKWKNELGAGVAFEAAVIDAPPAVDSGDVLVGNQRRLAAIAGDSGQMAWSIDPVPGGANTQSLSAIAVGDGIAVGVFHRSMGGVGAWDRLTGHELWRIEGEPATAVNVSPVIADGVVYIVNGSDEVLAIDALTGAKRWQVKLDAQGFDWGYATVGAPAIAKGVLVVPTLYNALVALDATTGVELWRHDAAPSPLRTTHYRGAGESGFEASPVITGDLVWAADTAGQLFAIDLHTGKTLWQTDLGTPVLGGLAVSGDWLVVASYDGAVRAFSRAAKDPATPDAVACDATSGGCCDAGGDPGGALALAGVVMALARGQRLRRLFGKRHASTATSGSA